jgi:methyl-accepting chemotaxis protein
MAGSSDRRELLGLMADVEGQTNLSMEKTEEFLLSGDERFKKAFKKSWGLNEQRFSKMKQYSRLFLPEQKVAITKIDRAIQKLGPLLKKIVRIRSQEGWNLANTLLGDKAAPIAFQIKEKLNEMSDSQSHLLQADMEAISNQTHRLIILLVMLFFAGALASGVLGAAITNSVSKPIQNVSRMARELAAGNLRQKKLPVVSDDELCELSQSLNQLLDRLKKVQPFSKPSSN